jgi:hypothetical protein
VVGGAVTPNFSTSVRQSAPEATYSGVPTSSTPRGHENRGSGLPMVNGCNPGTLTTRAGMVTCPLARAIRIPGVAVTSATQAEATSAFVFRSITQIASLPTSMARRGCW